MPMDACADGLGVDVVIPCHNCAATIGRTLAALESSSDFPTQVICVDDGSVDDTVEVIAKFAELSPLALRPLRRDVRAGAAAARNLGAAQSRAELLVFLDADVVVMPDTLAGLRRKLMTGPWAAAVAMYADHSAQCGRLAQFQAYLAHFVFARIDAADSPYLGTQCVMIYRDVLRASDGFDESYTGATVEDFEFGTRLRKAGHRICIATSAEIVHNHQYSARSFARNYYVKAHDLMGLMLSAGGFGFGGGYFDRSNGAALGLIGLVMAAIVAAAAIDPWFAVLALVATACLVIFWRDFLRPVVRARGLADGVAYFGLRSAVVLIGAAGALTAMLPRIHR